ncbi:uncharacterized protein ACA1_130980 [Acanthamoeba castellanii str. Neff]|uniref:Uncharacterized protein n=1 Tax=Acanthamoeba castellanii (strain ATCC 30010 / Neff) TaxID=1257118 RepID=L8GQD7_ACACF|nr:uncharacterized protein ACA1_130980 [Acanthamoeba castellanii str. Neff]ELR14873.1 hypothetical protein ACA1_130980 [Acanthamoeba castellanii str. Neff]
MMEAQGPICAHFLENCGIKYAQYTPLEECRTTCLVYQLPPGHGLTEDETKQLTCEEVARRGANDILKAENNFLLAADKPNPQALLFQALSTLSQTLKETTDALAAKVDALAAKVEAVQADTATLKADTATIKADTATIKADTAILKAKVGALELRIRAGMD